MAGLVDEKKVVEKDFSQAIDKICTSNVNVVARIQDVIDKMIESDNDDCWSSMHRDIFEAAIGEMINFRNQYQRNLLCLSTLLKEVHLSFVELDNITAANFKYSDTHEYVLKTVSSPAGGSIGEIHF